MINERKKTTRLLQGIRTFLLAYLEDMDGGDSYQAAVKLVTTLRLSDQKRKGSLRKVTQNSYCFTEFSDLSKNVNKFSDWLLNLGSKLKPPMYRSPFLHFGL